MDAEQQDIVDLMARWREASEAGDLEAVLALMTDDVVFLTPGNPPMSKADFAVGFRGFVGGHMRLEIGQEVREVRVAGDLAYAWTWLTVSMTASDGSVQHARSGHTLTVFRRGDDGDWRLARDANLLAPAA